MMLVAAIVLVLAVIALVRSALERFAVGIAGGLVRVVVALVVVLHYFVRAFAPLAVVAIPLGAIVSFAITFIAWRRYRGVPASHEAKMQRPFNAWLPVAIADAATVVINGLAAVSASAA